ncbi:MAG: HAMP domain-containing protein, partial [Thermoanaerobaculia bacterium]|nr:HAMP domain-containing protein [Thermoanaerobaculia bacterium]
MATASKASKRVVGKDHLTNRQILAGLRALTRGDFDTRLPDDYEGIDGEICAAFNELVVQVSDLGADLDRLRVSVGREGRTGARLRRGDLRGGWSDYVVSINETLDDLTSHTNEMASVVTAVGQGDLSRKMEIEGADEPVRGMFLTHAHAVNNMVDQLSEFGSEVTRVAREVGVNGKLGAQADVPGVSGAWKELTDNVNLMATNLTAQVRDIARVTTAVAQGDLSQSVTIEVKGEILELKNTINTMVDQLSSFADEVTRVAR